ncbi:histidine kinase [Actinomadura sp. ATCC 31491]|uniref:histidine kinase n=1 Tax=Actinomadura luzonensis TaxID=2805427 RepID=A0ABT0FQN6_9ACTN|nr:histidine kinase [Actinomadura luzonensis]MCK2214625.1 histidine kinase [Actinomadura luzonensis]
MGRAVGRAVRFLRRPKVADLALVIVISVPAVIGLVSMIVQGLAWQALGAAHYLVGASLLLMRRRRPILTAALVTALDAAAFAAHLTQLANVPSAVALYSVGRYTSGRTTALTALASYAAYTVAGELFWPGRGNWVGYLFSVGAAVGIGQLVRLRTELTARSRREAADAAVREERRRIARELHDVVAHHITVINALVGGARATLPAEQEVTRNALESAEQTARQAMTEMRRLLDVLRADGAGEGPDAATGVGAERLPALIKEARSAGLPASLSVTGEPVALPAPVDLAVYRIVQEALTNTRKHALGARASVRLAYGPDAVEVEVLDDGSVKGGGAPGFGLGGMAERVALCGGQLSTGPRPGGGFRVHARIPLERP